MDLQYSSSYGQSFCKPSSYTALPCRFVRLLFPLSLLCFYPTGYLSSIHNLNFILLTSCFPAPPSPASPHCQTSPFSYLENISMWMSNVCFKPGMSNRSDSPTQTKEKSMQQSNKNSRAVCPGIAILVNERPCNHSPGIRPKI